MQFTNRVVITGVDAAGNPRKQIKFNTLTHAASDVMIAAMLQSKPARVTHLYALYGTTNSNATLPSDLTAVTRANFMNTDGSTYGGLWVPLVAAPSVTSSDPTKYAGNLCTYYFRIPGTLPAAQYTGPWNNSGNGYISAIGLACAQNLNDRTQDLIISALPYYGSSAFTVASGAQESVQYPFQINT